MKTLNPAVARVLKRLHYPLDVILMCVRSFVAYGLSLRNLEETMAERGIDVDIRRCIDGQSSCCRCGRKRFAVSRSAQSARAGGWARLIVRPANVARPGGGEVVLSR